MLLDFKLLASLIIVISFVGTGAQSSSGSMGNTSLSRLFSSNGGFSFDQITGLLQSGILNGLVKDFAQTAKAKFEADVRFPCRSDMEMLLSDLLSKKMYALQFLDAEAKIPTGILQGQWQWTGDYQQCISVESPINKHTGHSLKGKYNNVALYRNGKPIVQDYFPLIIGLCLPDSCDKGDVKELATIGISPDNLASLNVTVAYVTNDDLPAYNGGAIAFLVISTVLLLLVFVGTILDAMSVHEANPKAIHQVDNKVNMKLQTERNNAIPLQNISNGAVSNDIKAQIQVKNHPGKGILFGVLTSFSILTNTKKFTNTSTANGPLACLNGMRVISMCWVMQGHCYVFMTFVADNQLYLSNIFLSRFTFHAIDNASFSIDTFFFLSGLLVAYMALKLWRDKGRINWVYYFVHRYWRLTPMYAFVILFLSALIIQTVTGPFQWVAMDPRGPLYGAWHLCQKDWWSNLLYINNLYPVLDSDSDGMCMTWSWYLANDMQFYIVISPIVVILLHKRKYIGWGFGVFLILACIGIRGFLVGYYGIHGENGIVSKHTDETLGKHDPLYHRPFARYGPYVVGMLTGHLLLYTNCKIRMRRFVVFIGWCVAIAVALSVLYGLHAYSKPADRNMSLTASGFYNSLSRTAWTLSIAWLTVACATGYGGWVNAILSWKIWAPLGRLTYSAYLVHALVIVIYYLNAKDSFHINDSFMVFTYVGVVGISYGVGYIVSMVVEVPMMQLERLVLGRK